MNHPCAIDTCDASIPTSMLMCRKHWFMVPPAIRARVNREWSITPDLRALESAAYMEARQAAINAVQEKLARGS